jgi:protoheme IX farnesyltransferase
METTTTRQRKQSSVFVELTKLPITAMVTLTAATGYVLESGRLEWAMLIPMGGLLLLAMGSAVLNHCQEVGIDSRMTRTRNRPIPSGRITLVQALFVSGLLMLLGLYLLASGQNVVQTTVLGLLAVFWYNGVYTYLKRLTAFAVVPGALIGAIPPVIGWSAAGGLYFEPLILLVGFFFFIWQIPHFWLLVILHGKEYEEAGLPALTSFLSRAQLARITCVWFFATAVTGLFFPALVPDMSTLPLSILCVAGSVWLGAKSFGLIRKELAPDEIVLFRTAFMHINYYALMIMFCLTFGALSVTWN